MKIITVIAILCSFNSAFAQKELIERLEKQAIETDSLKKLIKAELDSRQLLKNENNNIKDTLKKLRNEITNLEEFKKSKKNIDLLLEQKTDSIRILKVSISEKEKQITIDKQKSAQTAKEEFEKGKNEILTIVANKYKNQTFDELLKSSTKQSVSQDLSLCQGLPEIYQILSDIIIYYNANELLDAKIDAAQLKSQLIQLGQIKRKSVALDKLKEIISNYQTFNDGFKETAERIIALDKKEVVSGMSNEIQKKKLGKILAEVSSYIFNYDFNFSNYPFLSHIILELIKLKQPNPDADISDLIKKL